MHELICRYKRNAKQKNLEYNLTEEQFVELSQKDCYYCGSKPNNIAKGKTNYGEYIYNGIDRIENTKGYTIDNVVPCCRICNIAKQQLTLQEFKDWIKRIYNNMFNKKGD